MNLKSFLFPSVYSAIVIVSTCITFYTGQAQHINKVAIIDWLLIVPFCVMAMLYAKKTMYFGNIGGKDAAREGLKFIIFSTIILVIFQSIFFTLDFKAYKINFIETYGLELAKEQVKNGHLKIKDSELPNLIKQEVAQITLFKEATSIVFKNLFLGTITTVITAVTLRANIRG